jgi:hypothetical protein
MDCSTSYRLIETGRCPFHRNGMPLLSANAFCNKRIRRSSNRVIFAHGTEGASLHNRLESPHACHMRPILRLATQNLRPQNQPLPVGPVKQLRQAKRNLHPAGTPSILVQPKTPKKTSYQTLAQPRTTISMSPMVRYATPKTDRCGTIHSNPNAHFWLRGLGVEILTVCIHGKAALSCHLWRSHCLTLSCISPLIPA